MINPFLSRSVLINDQNVNYPLSPPDSVQVISTRLYAFNALEQNTCSNYILEENSNISKNISFSEQHLNSPVFQSLCFDDKNLDIKDYQVNIENIPLFFKVKQKHENTFFSSFSSIQEHYKSDPSIKINSPLPIAVRHIDSTGKLYIERPPFKANVTFKGSKASSRQEYKELSVWVPWSITVLDPKRLNSEIKIYFSHKSLESQDDLYVPCAFPNTYSHGAICFSSSLSDLQFEQSEFLDYRYIYSMIINEYFSGGWNLDIYPINFLSYLNGYNKSSIINQIKYPTYEFLSELFEPSKAKQYYINYSRIGAGYTQESSIYAMDVMSSLTLEQTLQFYQELLREPEKLPTQSQRFVKKFREISDTEDMFSASSNLSYNSLYTSNERQYYNYCDHPVSANFHLNSNNAYVCLTYTTIKSIIENEETYLKFYSDLTAELMNVKQQSTLIYYDVDDGISVYDKPFDTGLIYHIQAQYINDNFDTVVSPIESDSLSI